MALGYEVPILTYSQLFSIQPKYVTREQGGWIVSTRLDDTFRIAFFISPHGLGHAARAAAVMGALHEIDPTITFEVFTTIPKWFFDDSLSKPFAYHPTLTDIGMVQKTPFCEDLQNTLKRLGELFPFDQNQIDSIARLLSKRKCRLIVCDISPMGISVGKASDIPSVLVENFTWDWIYESYAMLNNNFNFYIKYLKGLFEKASYHIQTEPVCCYRDVDILIPPISRKPRTSSTDTRKNLNRAENSPVVMITMGGIPQHYTIQNTLREHEKTTFVISGGNQSFQRMNNVVILPYRSEFYHPDLIHASDVVVGKAGYSTLAEVYDAGVPFIFIKRPTFRESEIMAAYIHAHITSFDITENQFEKGHWIFQLPDLLSLPKAIRNGKPGAQQAAEYIYRLSA